MPLPARWRSLLARPQGRALLAAAVTALALAVARFKGGISAITQTSLDLVKKYGSGFK